MKVNWTLFITDTVAALIDIQPPPDKHNANTIVSNIIIHAMKHCETSNHHSIHVHCLYKFD